MSREGNVVIQQCDKSKTIPLIKTTGKDLHRVQMRGLDWPKEHPKILSNGVTGRKAFLTMFELLPESEDKELMTKLRQAAWTTRAEAEGGSGAV